MKRLLLCFVLALLAVVLCMVPAIGSVYQEPGRSTLPADSAADVVVTTLPATNVVQNSATLNANVSLTSGRADDGNTLIYVLDDHITVYFQYGTSSGVYTKTTPPVSRSYSSTVAFSAIATVLDPCTRYYARALVSAPVFVDYQKQDSDYLISFLSSGPHSAGMRGRW